MDTIIAILAGGESRRMGRDKAALLWEGRTFLERLAEESLRAAPRVVVAGPARRGWPFPTVPFLQDAAVSEGPLRGLEASLAFAGDSAVLAVACDMPLLRADGFRWLLTRETLSPHGLVVVRQGQPEPLFSVYPPACLPLVRQQLARGRRSLHGLIAAGAFDFVDAPPEVAAQLENVNTPDQLRILHRHGGASPPGDPRIQDDKER